MKDGLLEFKDAPMFGRVMRDPEICKEVLERFLGFGVEHIEYLNAEHVLDPATDAKGVRLDVFAKSTGRVYDIEMQVAHDRALGKRMRYYQASIDQSCLDKGAAYDGLEESYIIFVCDFDAFGSGLPAYHFERACEEEASVSAGDGSHWLVLNASAWGHDADPARSGLLNYIHANVVADDALIHRIETAVDAANRDAEWRERAMGFMTLEHSHRAELSIARRMGIEEGMKQGMKQGISEGEARFGRLVDALLEAERIEDLRRAADDQDFRDTLFADLGL